MNYSIVFLAITISIIFVTIPDGFSPIFTTLTLFGIGFSYFALRNILGDKEFLKQIKERFSK